MPSIHVSKAGAQRLVQQAVRDGHHVADHAPHGLIATEDTGHVARRLVDAILDRLQMGGTERNAYEVNLINELDGRETRGSAEAFAAAAEAAWIRQHEEGYPDSSLPPDARQGPHGSPGHVCWQDLATVSPVAGLQLRQAQVRIDLPIDESIVGEPDYHARYSVIGIQTHDDISRMPPVTWVLSSLDRFKPSLRDVAMVLVFIGLRREEAVVVQRGASDPQISAARPASAPESVSAGQGSPDVQVIRPSLTPSGQSVTGL